MFDRPAEYNHSVTGASKNALDQAYVEWVRKPFSALGYGSTGGARAIEHLRGISVELQMVPSKFSVHIGGSDLFKVHPAPRARSTTLSWELRM